MIDLTDEELVAVRALLKIAIEFGDIEWGDAEPGLLQSALDKIEAHQIAQRTEGKLGAFIGQFERALKQARALLAEADPPPAGEEGSS